MVEIDSRSMCELEMCINKTQFPLASTAITSAASRKRILPLALIAIRADFPASSVRVAGKVLLRCAVRPVVFCRKPGVRGARMHSCEGTTISSAAFFPKGSIACSRCAAGTTGSFACPRPSPGTVTTLRMRRSPLSKRPPLPCKVPTVSWLDPPFHPTTSRRES